MRVYEVVEKYIAMQSNTNKKNYMNALQLNHEFRKLYLDKDQ